MSNCTTRHTKTDGSWWAHDAQGIPLCRVCGDCEAEKLSGYRPEILKGYTQADVDEPIEPEEPYDREAEMEWTHDW